MDDIAGIGEPRQAKNGLPLPSARLVSQTLFQDMDRPSAVVTVMHMTFGQLLDHDIGRTAMTMLKDNEGKCKGRETFYTSEELLDGGWFM